MELQVHKEIDIKKIEDSYKSFILCENHPSILANALFRMELYQIRAYEDINDLDNLKQLLLDVESYLNQNIPYQSEVESFVAAFPNNYYEDEILFENALLQTLNMLNHLEHCEWDQNVSDVPDTARFSFSINGRSFYILGLHPESSKMARQAPYTTLVFNQKDRRG